MSLAHFISFEGIDGAGKSTHMLWFADQLRLRGQDVLLTREPGGTALAEKIRKIVLNDEMAPLTELLLVYAARHEHLMNQIGPALAAGKWVICDRFVDSTVAYQGAGRAMPSEQIATLTEWVVGTNMPSRTYIFDLQPEVAATRRQAARSADRFEAEEVAFFERVRGGYLALAKENPDRLQVIDAALSVDQIRQHLAVEIELLCPPYASGN